MEVEREPRNSGGSATMHRDGQSALLAGIEVRDEDVEIKKSLHIAGVAFRIATVVIILLAGYEVFDWLRDPPPGGAGWSVLISDTVRLLVIAILLYGAADLADLMSKNHYEIRATRILLARQTYLLRQLGIASGTLAPTDIEGDRRGLAPEEVVGPPHGG